MRFSPTVGERVVLLGDTYTVQPKPGLGLEGHVHASEGARATVFQISDSHRELWALKVFKRAFRLPRLLETTDRLAPLATVPGFRAAKRKVISPSDQIVTRYRDLEFAVLMPWVRGKTWFDVLSLAARGDLQLQLNEMLDVTERFLAVVRILEARSCAHTDISQGNIVLDLSRRPPSVELLDLEDLYVPGEKPASELNIGTNGYRHRSSERGGSVWCAEGDRYAAAVMAAEMLVLAEPSLARQASSEGYFIGHVGTETGIERFDAAYPWLRRVVPAFAEGFATAWRSNQLSECPTISDLYRALTARPSASSKELLAPDNSDQITWIPLPTAPPREREVTIEPEDEVGAQYWSSTAERAAAKQAATKRPKPQPPAPATARPLIFTVVSMILLVLLLQLCSG